MKTQKKSKPPKRLTIKERADASKRNSVAIQGTVLTATDADKYLAQGQKEKEKRKNDSEEKQTTLPGVVPKRAIVVIVVQAKDGKWLYGAEADEAKLRATAKGKYANAADASKEAAKDHDIVINTAPPEAKPPKEKKGWGKADPAKDSPTATTTEGAEMKTKQAKSPSLKASKSAVKKPGKAVITKPDAKAKAVKAKAAPAKAATKGNSKFSEAAKITWLIKENPKLKGTKSHARFAKYFGAKTVGEYFTKGGRRSGLRWDIAHKFLSVAEAK